MIRPSALVDGPSVGLVISIGVFPIWFFFHDQSDKFLGPKAGPRQKVRRRPEASDDPPKRQQIQARDYAGHCKANKRISSEEFMSMLSSRGKVRTFKENNVGS